MGKQFDQSKVEITITPFNFPPMVWWHTQMLRNSDNPKISLKQFDGDMLKAGLILRQKRHGRNPIVFEHQDAFSTVKSMEEFNELINHLQVFIAQYIDGECVMEIVDRHKSNAVLVERTKISRNKIEPTYSTEER